MLSNIRAYFHWLLFVKCIVYSKHKVKFMHISNHTEHYRKYLFYLTRTKHNCTSTDFFFVRIHWSLFNSKGLSAFPPTQTAAKVIFRLHSHGL